MNIISDNTLVSVRNLVDHRVVYTIPELNRRVVFEAFQEKKVPASELRALNYTVGGETLIHDYLCILNKDLREEFNIPSDMIEYDWTLKDIENVLLNPDEPIEALEDALDFGPAGIREMLIDYAVKLKIPDTNRRKVISKMANVNIDRMIEFSEQEEENEEKVNTRRMTVQKQTRNGRRLQN